MIVETETWMMMVMEIEIPATGTAAMVEMEILATETEAVAAVVEMDVVMVDTEILVTWMAVIATVEMETRTAVEMEMLVTETEVAAAVVETAIVVTGMEVEAAMWRQNLATWMEVVTLATGIVVEAGLMGMDNQSMTVMMMELAEVNKITMIYNVAKVNIHSVPVINVG